MKQMLQDARSGGYAVAAFNPVDFSTMKAIVRGAEELRTPVIAQTTARTINYYSHETLFSWMAELAADSTTPVALHLDHGKDMDMIRKCIEVGWTSVTGAMRL